MGLFILARKRPFLVDTQHAACYDLHMNDDVITDLKQFITATVSQATVQQTSDLRNDINRIDTKVDKIEVKLGKVEKKLDSLTEFVTETFDTTNDETDKQLAHHEQRLIKLEHSKV